MGNKYEPLGRGIGINKDGASGANRDHMRRLPIHGKVEGADTIPDTSYDGIWPKLRDMRKVQAPTRDGKVAATPTSGEKKLGQGWKGQHRPLFGDPKDGQKGGSASAQRGDWDILSGDDLL